MLRTETSKTTSFLICLFVYLLAITAAWYSTLLFGENLSSMVVAFIADVVATVIVFFFSLGFKNSSLYDPYWSVAPPLIIGFWMSATPTGFSIVSVIILLVTSFWSLRLTINWMRGWGGLSHEDWRYVQLRQQNPRLYPLINFSGIHLFPTVIVFICLIPAFFAINATETSSYAAVITGAILCVSATIFALVADEQMRAFRMSANEAACMESGLWKYSRHPNYLGEILFWVGIWIMAIGVDLDFYWTIFGCIALTLMFIFISIPMMEKRNLSKRKNYAEVKKRVPMFFKGF